MARDWLQEMWNIVAPYVWHQTSCTFGKDTPDGEFCNCGFSEMKEKLRKLKKEKENG